MKQKALLFLVFLLVGTAFAFSQDPPATTTPPSKLGIKGGYFGEFVLHPGLVAGISYTLRQKKHRALHWDSEIGAYFHKWNNNSAFLQSTIGYRMTSKIGVCVDVNAGLGYLASAPSGDVYNVDENGELTTSGRPIHSHLKPTVSLLVGWDGNRNRNIPLIIQTGLELYGQTAFNNSILPHAAWRLEAIYFLPQKN